MLLFVIAHDVHAVSKEIMVNMPINTKIILFIVLLLFINLHGDRLGVQGFPLDRLDNKGSLYLYYPD